MSFEIHASLGAALIYVLCLKKAQKHVKMLR